MHYKVNTVKTRVYSLLRQGRMYYRAMDTMRQSWLEPMLLEFDKFFRAHQLQRACGWIYSRKQRAG